MNTYKGSIRDGRKYLTCNGKVSPPLHVEWNWGWGGKLTSVTAYYILCMEFGKKTADDTYLEFSRRYLALQPEEGFIIGSNYLAYIVDKVRMDNYFAGKRL
jgi:hypothetical protein